VCCEDMDVMERSVVFGWQQSFVDNRRWMIMWLSIQLVWCCEKEAESNGCSADNMVRDP
jgi:hypothetical protein